MSDRSKDQHSGHASQQQQYWKNTTRSLPGSAVSVTPSRGPTSPVTQQPSSVTNSLHPGGSADKMSVTPRKPLLGRSTSGGGKSSFKDYEANTLDAWAEGDDDTMVIPKLLEATNPLSAANSATRQPTPLTKGSTKGQVKIDPKMVTVTAQKVLENHSSVQAAKGSPGAVKASPLVHGSASQRGAGEGGRATPAGRSRAPGEDPSSLLTNTGMPRDRNNGRNHSGSSTRGDNPASSASSTSIDSREQSKIAKLDSVINSASTNMDELRQLSWSGIPKKLRPTTWKILSGYLPSSQDRRAQTLKRKREEYFGFVDKYFDTRHEETYAGTFRQIHIDVPRMNPLIPLFQNVTVQEIFERILYIWAIRHPASGYVQGINDLVTPFFIVFLSEYLDADTNVKDIRLEGVSPTVLKEVEADTYWCTTRLLEGIQDNYTFAQPGIQKKVQQLKNLMLRIDNALCEHLDAHNIEFLQFSFRWMNNLLMREFPLHCSIRLWDTYQAEPEGFSHFHLYVCAAFLSHFSKELLAETDFQGLMTALQNLPTAGWDDEQVGEVLAQAFKLKYLFADSPQHTR